MYIIKWHKAWNAKREGNRKLFFPSLKCQHSCTKTYFFFFFLVEIKTRSWGKMYMCIHFDYFLKNFHFPEHRECDKPVLADNNVTVLESHVSVTQHLIPWHVIARVATQCLLLPKWVEFTQSPADAFAAVVAAWKETFSTSFW